LFNRDQDTTPDEKKPAAAASQSIETVTDAERASLVFSAYDLDVHLAPAMSQMAVHAKVTVRNSATVPLARLALQISSSLKWESFAAQNVDRIAPLSFVQHTIDTDADHTGKAQEAIVTLPKPLAPGASMELTVFYDGTMEQSGERLMRIGAPAEQAAHADWDAVTPDRIALRGFGNVLWYPTAAAPVFLGDGAKLFQIVGQTKLLQAPAKVRLRLAVEYVGDPPDSVYFCGQREKLVVVSENVNLVVAESPGVATAEFSERPLGFRALSLFVTDRAATMTDGDLISAVTDHYDTLPAYATAALKVQPLLKSWLGADPRTVLNIIDQNGQPFEDDALLVTQMHAVEPAVLAQPLVHSLSHAWFSSSHVWLDEGVPQFMSLLWVEQSEGREAALNQLQQQVNTLSLAEPAASQNADSTQVGQSLIEARDEVYYRTKAAAVLWMLRSIVGEDALKQALQLYRQDERADADPKQFQRVLERASKRDLGWFFEDWVYRDRGLPDLTIASVTPRKLPVKAVGDESWLIAIEVRNDGDAAAEVPVTVRSGTLTTTEKLRIMGRSTASTRIVFAGRPDEVVVNDGGVPEVTAPTHSRQIEVQ
jgi:Peptidase family M1 domain